MSKIWEFEMEQDGSGGETTVYVKASTMSKAKARVKKWGQATHGATLDNDLDGLGSAEHWTNERTKAELSPEEWEVLEKYGFVSLMDLGSRG